MKQNYASEVAAKLQELGLYVDVDNGENTLNKKIRNGEIAQYNFILGTFLLYITMTIILSDDTNQPKYFISLSV